MNRKLAGALIIVVGASLFAGIVYFMFFSNFSISDIFNKFTNKEAAQEEIKIDENNNVKKIGSDGGNVKRISSEGGEDVQKIESEKKSEIAGQETNVSHEDLKRMASSFSERFGSFSNHSNFSNIVDLKIFMSKNMKSWADNYIAGQKSKNLDNAIYYGITTKAIGEEIKEFDDDINKAEVLVKTRRREAIGTTNNMSDIFSQEILIVFVKETGVWKVDSATWQEM